MDGKERKRTKLFLVSLIRCQRISLNRSSKALHNEIEIDLLCLAAAVKLREDELLIVEYLKGIRLHQGGYDHVATKPDAETKGYLALLDILSVPQWWACLEEASIQLVKSKNSGDGGNLNRYDDVRIINESGINREGYALNNKPGMLRLDGVSQLRKHRSVAS